jgi:signal peptidase I
MKEKDPYPADKDMSEDSVKDSIKDSAKDNPMKEVKEWAQAIITAVVLALLIRAFLFEIILVDGSSMLPTLNDADRVFVNKIGYIIGKPEHGDVIIFKTPEDPHTNYVKRLIGLPGDKVRVVDGVVYVNDEPLTEPYILEPPYSDYAEVTVPEGRFFALGDNRNGSKDSRDSHVGFVPLKNLLGKAVFRVWPFNNLTPIE